MKPHLIKGVAHFRNSICERVSKRSLHLSTDQEQALCRVCDKPLDSSMHIKCIVTERNEATKDPALEAEFEKVFGKGGVR